jgi:hypothetical protein
MKLIDYIKQHYNGVVSQFADDNGMKRQQVESCLAKGYYHIIRVEGELMLIMAKRTIKESNNEKEA